MLLLAWIISFNSLLGGSLYDPLLQLLLTALLLGLEVKSVLKLSYGSAGINRWWWGLFSSFLPRFWKKAPLGETDAYTIHNQGKTMKHQGTVKGEEMLNKFSSERDICKRREYTLRKDEPYWNMSTRRDCKVVMDPAGEEIRYRKTAAINDWGCFWNITSFKK